MTTGKAKPSTPAAGEIDAFMAQLKHPLQSAIEMTRQAILAASPEIAEGIKWNAPSFRTTEYFATFHLRAAKEVQLIFHRGAKVRKDTADIALPDPKSLVKWLAKDRCLVTLGDGAAVAQNRAALTAIVREWIKHV